MLEPYHNIPGFLVDKMRYLPIYITEQIANTQRHPI